MLFSELKIGQRFTSDENLIGFYWTKLKRIAVSESAVVNACSFDGHFAFFGDDSPVVPLIELQLTGRQLTIVSMALRFMRANPSDIEDAFYFDPDHFDLPGADGEDKLIYDGKVIDKPVEMELDELLRVCQERSARTV